MNKSKQPGIKFESIFLVKENFERKNTLKDNLKIDIHFEINNDLEDERSAVELQTFLKLIDKDDNTLFNLNFSYVAIFSVVEKYKNMEMDSFIKNNAPALIFPYIRQHIQEVTTNAGLVPLILPPMNLIALINSDKKEHNETM